MRLKRQIQELRKEANKHRKSGGNKQYSADYYEGMIIALDWVLEKKDEPSHVWGIDLAEKEGK